MCGVFLESWSLAVSPPQLCWVKAVISLLTLGFAATSFSFSFSFYFPFFRDALKSLAVHGKVTQAGMNRRCLRWVDWRGNSVPVSSEVTATSQFRSTVLKVSRGEALGDVGDFLFRDPEHFRVARAC